MKGENKMKNIKNKIATGLVLVGTGLSSVINNAKADTWQIGTGYDSDKNYAVSARQVIEDESETLGPINSIGGEIGLNKYGFNKLVGKIGADRGSYGVSSRLGFGSINSKQRGQFLVGVEAYKILPKNFYLSVKADKYGKRKSVGFGLGRRF